MRAHGDVPEGVYLSAGNPDGIPLVLQHTAGFDGRWRALARRSRLGAPASPPAAAEGGQIDAPAQRPASDTTTREPKEHIMPSMSQSEIDEFLREPRIGVLCTNDLDGSPNGVPVWFEWDGERIRMFSSASHKKMVRLENDPRASLLVAREVGEPEAWIAVDGVVAITEEEGVVLLMERLAARYWDDEDPAVARAHAETVELWRRAAAQLRVLTIVPDEIRSYSA